MQSLLDKALALAATGIPVFPCRSTPLVKATDKTPACPNGFKDATVDPDRIRQLFATPSAKLIGVPTGPASGFDVLDLDPRHGSDEWEKTNNIPATRIHLTQSSGKHILFQSAADVKNSQSKIAPGLDVRGKGGFIIWWPAFGCEVWLDTDIAPWPANLLAAATAPKPRNPRVARITRAVNSPTPDSAKQALDDAVKIIEAAVEGERHETIRDLCMSIAALVNADMLDEEEAHEAIIAAAHVCGAEDMDNVENSWSSAIEKADPAEPNTGDELGPLPDLDEEEDERDINPDLWETRLLRGKPDKNGNPGPMLANLHNGGLYFRFHRDWKGRLRLNEFSHVVEIDGRPITDVDGLNATSEVQKYGLGITDLVAFKAMTMAAHRNRYHPVRDLLVSFVWDGKARLDRWLSDYAGAVDTPLTRAFAAKTVIAIVARVMDPGCKVDTVLILEGPQGLKKSSLFATMAFRPEWFLDDLGDLNDKDTFDMLKGKLLVELAELDHMNRSDVSSFKKFVVKRVDTYRAAFGRVTQDYARQCVLVGSINPGATGYLKDETGARRFWPVAVGVGKPDGWKIDLGSLERDREQLYGEAVARFKRGEKWYLETAALEAMQRVVAEERSEEDPWHSEVAKFLADRHVTTISDVLVKAIGMQPDAFRKLYANQVGAILKRMGWVKRSVRSGKSTSSSFVSPEYVATSGKCNVVTLQPPSLAEIAS